MLDLFQSPQIKLPSKAAWFYRRCLDLIPRQLDDVVTWADRHYRIVNNDSEYFRSAESPWLIEPLQMADDPLVRSLTFVKPIQTGGTSLGEIILLRRALDSHGQLSYLWPTNDKAKDRWEKWTEKRIRACLPVRALLPYEYENMLVKFKTGLTFAMQGVFTSGNLDSDTVDIIINEEVHQWQPGMLAKAKGRQTRVDFPKFITISNSGDAAGELHTDFNNGTQQHYLIRCPGCKKLHIARTRWEDNRPDLGGLRYDSEGCRRPDGTFDYNKLVPTIRYQFPIGSALQHPNHDYCHCGYEMRDDVRERREAASTKLYSEPFNTGALLINRSYTYQAVACHNIRWLDLIQEKHNALRSLKAGDDKAWRQYLQERESVFYDAEEHRPYQGSIVITSGQQKQREGLPGEIFRPFAFDWQQGFKHLGELTHYWGVIESVLPDCSSQVIAAAKLADETDLLGFLKDHGITDANAGGISDGFIDASKNTKHILSFCFRTGINAVIGGDQGLRGFRHEDGTWRYYSPRKYIWRELNLPEPKYPLRPTRAGWVEDPAEPYIVRYNKAGLLKNSFFISEMKANVLARDPAAGPESYIQRIVPEDIGEDYLKHHEAWRRDFSTKGARKMGEVEGFKQVARADHLMSCTTYIDMLKDITGLLGNRLSALGINRQDTKDTKEN